MKLRKRLENSDTLAAVLSWGLAGYLRICFATTRWENVEVGGLEEDLKNGPIILVLWHGRLLFGPSAWPIELSPLFTLRDPSPAGRLSSDTQTRLGMQPIMMHANASNFTASKKILQHIRKGNSLAMTADGPMGPNQNAKQAPIEWARATGCPVYLFAWSARRNKRLGTWDKMMMPVPFTRGAYIYRKWETDVPRKIDAAGYTALRRKLSDDLDRVVAEADALAGGAE